MAKIDKLLEKWATNTPREENFESVESVIKRFFPDQFDKKIGSHIVITDSRLIGKPGIGPAGDFTVVSKGGKKVKGFYVKRLAEIIYELGLNERGKGEENEES